MVLFISDPLSSVWGHSVQVAKFPNFQKVTSSTIFIQLQPNFMKSMVIGGEYRLLVFSQYAKCKTNFMAL